MPHRSLDLDPAWFLATTLAERAAALPIRHSSHSTVADGAAVEQAHGKLRRWREQPPFGRSVPFAQRLSEVGLSQNELTQLLAVGADDLRRHFVQPPQWMQEVDAAIRDAECPADHTALADDAHVAGFLSPVAPLIHRARRRVRETIAALDQSHKDRLFDPTTVEHLLYKALPRRLLTMTTRTVVLEMHVAKMRGELGGRTSEERFASFVDRLRDPDMTASLLREYPALARQAAVAVDQWAETSSEFLDRLCRHGSLLVRKFFGGEDPGLLTDIEADAGDQHRGGRTVLLLTFGADARLAYKPKSLAVESHFEQLIEWLNSRGADPALRALKVLDCVDHGWTEFVRFEPCESQAEVERFYRRQGAYLAVLYMLGATDMHADNLIAGGEYPMLVDLEALFHQPIPTPPKDAASDGLSGSVVATRLLPQQQYVEGSQEVIDFSGLGGAAEQPTPYSVSCWQDVGTDQMRLVRQDGRLAGAHNRPTLRGADVKLGDHQGTLEAGFRSTYMLLVKHRDQLIAGDGPVARFADDEVRFIPRPSQAYAILLEQGLHPDRLRDALERDRLFDQLWARAADFPCLAQLIPAERAALAQNDIPLFATRPSSRDLDLPCGGQLQEFFAAPAIERAYRRIENFGEADLTKQLWLIRASFGMMPENMVRHRRQSVTNPMQDAAAAPDELLAAAHAIGNRLAALAHRKDNEAGWLGCNPVRQRDWSLGPLGADLYDGLPGVALFLAYLADCSGAGQFRMLAERTVAGMRRSRRFATPVNGVGAFRGAGGVIYALTHLGTLWREPSLLDEAAAIASRIPDLARRSEHTDVMDGVSGAVVALCTLYHVVPEPNVLQAAMACGQLVLERIDLSDAAGQSGDDHAIDRQSEGLAHGLLGIAWAMRRLASASGEERFAAAAARLIEQYRRRDGDDTSTGDVCRRFVAADAADPRSRDLGIDHARSWCRGATGKALALMACGDWLETADVRAATDTLREANLLDDDSLCHGNAGHLDALLHASGHLHDPSFRDMAMRRAGGLLRRVGHRHWRCSSPSRIETPGLMTGISGIGYQMLRLARPARVPSVLTLDPPRC